MEDLAALRAIIGEGEPEEELALLLGRAHGSVEAALNMYYELKTASQPPSSQPSSASSASTAKRPAAVVDAAARKHAKTLNQPRGTSSAVEPPLAERMRPSALEELIGQEQALSDAIRQALAADRLPSIILWGPPGCGKTSFAAVVAASTQRIFRSLSAAKAGVQELRDELSRAVNTKRLRGVGTILFVDELHRWSKAQQDALLMDCEKGHIILIGATTENPSFSLNNAILSRCERAVTVEDAVARRCSHQHHGGE